MPLKGVTSKLPKPIGTLTDIGHSHMADAGATKPYYGAVHKIDGLLQPATYRSTSQGGAIHSRTDQGNTAGGDGGWGRQLGEFARLENSYGDSGTLWPATTMTAGPYAVGATSFTVNSIQGFYPNEYIVVGAGANTEIVRIYGSPSGSTITIQAPGFTKTHAATDPVYHSMTNFGAGGAGQGYDAKDEIVLIGVGGNDIAPLGPYAQGVFGTDAGASRGLVPFQNALRFTIAQMRCAVIYLPNHSSHQFGAGYAISAQSAPQSYGVQGYFSPTPGQNGSLGYTQTTVNSTITVATAPDFPGGTVCFFFASSGANGGALYNLSIDGSTTVPFAGTGVLDTRGKYFVQYNSSLAQSTAGGATSADTGVVYRITGLTPGVHTFLWTVTALGSATYNGIYLGWGVEAPVPPMIFCFLDPRLPSYTAYSASPYATRAPVNTQGISTQTATVGAGAGTAAGSVALGTAVTVGTTATGDNAVYPGDSITIGAGATQETRRIVGVTTTAVSVDANFVNAHTGEFCVIGYQDADLVGGGYRNQADTQGKTSVPGIHSIIRGVAAEFDRFVQPFSVDTVFTGGPGNPGPTTNSPYFAADFSHYSDYGQGLLAAQFYQTLVKSAWADSEIALSTVPSQRTYNPVAGDTYPTGQPAASGAWPVFFNGWTNFWPINAAYPRTGFYMDMRTREVYVRGAITNALVYPDQLPSAVFQLPPGYRPAYQTYIKAWGPLGPVMMEIDNQGYVYVSAGYWNLTNGIGGSTGAIMFEDVFLSES